MKLRTIILALFCILFNAYAFSQLSESTNLETKFKNKNLNKYSPKDGKQVSTLFQKTYPDGTINLRSHNVKDEKEILSLLDIPSESTFKILDEKVNRIDKNSITIRYQQYYKGIKVKSGGYVIKKDIASNKIQLFSPRIYHSINLDPSNVIEVCDLKGSICKDKVHESELVISNQYENDYKLIWEILHNDHGGKFSHIDALTGELLYKEKASCETDLLAETQTYGTVTLENFMAGVNSTLENLDQSISIYDFDPESIGGVISSYNPDLIPSTDSDIEWTDETHYNAYQTMFSSAQVVPFFASNLGIDFLNVHAAANISDQNARAYLGSNLTNAYITIGIFTDDDANDHSLALHDIVAHELGHCYLFPYLNITSLGPLSLHEGISDMFGTYIESLIQPDGIDWVMADDDPVVATEWIQRDLEEEVLFGNTNAPNSQHLRSRPLGHWYYLISTGNLDNPVTGLGPQLALELVLASLPYAGMDADYPELAVATLAYAADIYGACSETYALIFNAWQTINVPVQQDDCCENVEDVVISTDTNYPNEMLSGNILIQQGASLTISSNIRFAEGTGITVEAGGRLLLEGATLDRCSAAESWNGVLVNSFGRLTAEASVISGATNAVWAKQESFIDIVSLDLNGIGVGNGLFMEQRVYLTANPVMTIQSFETGVLAFNIIDPVFYRFNSDLKIFQCNDGMNLSNVMAVIDGSIFISTNNGIILNRAHGTMISNVFMQYQNIGINATRSYNITIDGNRIGGIGQMQVGEIGVYLENCNRSNITNNPRIIANRIGIEIWDSETVISENEIEVDGTSEYDDGGIKISFSENATIEHNYFDLSECQYGIQTNNCVGTTISHNSILNNNSGIRSACIKSEGSSDEIIMSNDIQNELGSKSGGIRALNSSFNQYTCNDLANSEDGLRIHVNSEIHTIRGNEFRGCRDDLIIRSRIGLQAFAGNRFMSGSVKALGLTNFDLGDSRFLVNSNINFHMPSVIQPNNNHWFVDFPNEPNFFNDCDDAGPGWFNSPNQTFLCNYFRSLKRQYATNPDQVFVKLVHLMKFYGSNLPNCILQDPLINSICGLKDIVKFYRDLKVNRSGRLESPQLDALHNSFLQAQGRTRRIMASRIGQYLNQNYQDFETDIQKHNLALNSLKDNLDLLDCPAIAGLWANVLSSNIKYLIDGTIDPELVNHAQLCSDRYGDVIHLARALVNTQENIDLDIYDNCDRYENTRQRSVTQEPPLKPQSNSIYPNPASNQIMVDFENEFSGTIQIRNLEGKLLMERDEIKQSKAVINFSLNSGIYVLSTISVEGEIKTDKFVVIHNP